MRAEYSKGLISIDCNGTNKVENIILNILEDLK